MAANCVCKYCLMVVPAAVLLTKDRAFSVIPWPYSFQAVASVGSR